MDKELIESYENIFDIGQKINLLENLKSDMKNSNLDKITVDKLKEIDMLY